MYEYIRRVFGQFKVTGIIDMFYGTGNGAQGFAELKEEFSAWAEGKTAYDLAELLWERMVGPYTSLTEFVEEFKKIDFGGSYFEASFKADKKGRLTSASFEFNMDAVYTDGDFSDQAEAVYSGTMTLSYDAFTLEAPSKDQLVPSVGASEVDLEAGTVFIPIEWNSAKPDDFTFEGAYIDAKIIVHYQDEYFDDEWYEWISFEDIDLMQFVETHKTEEGVLVDFSGLVENWQTLRAEIDANSYYADDPDVTITDYELNIELRGQCESGWGYCSFAAYITADRDTAVITELYG